MKKVKSMVLMAALVSGVGAAAENPLWLRNAAISPDGKTVAFTYKGDIFTVPVTGGQARQLTTSKEYDSAPMWAPDGKRIVFTSNRLGSDDIYIIPAQGGTARRLTTYVGSEIPLTFLPDGRLLFAANIMPGRTTAQAPFGNQMYVIDTEIDSPRPELYLSVPALSASANAEGKILYQDKKGFENIWRKHERSSGTSDVWMVDPAGKFTQLTTFNGHDLNPVWGSGDTFYYLSEEADNNLNVYQGTAKAGQKGKQLTFFKENPVRSLSVSNNGVLAFSQDGELYTMPADGKPQKINVQIITDDFNNDIIKSFSNRGASTMAVNKAADEVAFVIRGDVYATSVKYPTTVRITNTPGQERRIDIAPDGRSVVYDSEREGNWQLFISKIKNPDEKKLAYATEFVEEPLYSCETSAQQPVFSPDGKKVAFLEDRTILKVIDVNTKEVTTALDGKYNYSYTDGDISFAWSPDSKWLLIDYIGVGGWNNSDIALVAADGSKVVDLTESGYADSNPQWAMGGRAITYSTGRYGMKSHGSWGNQSDVMMMVLDPEAWDEFNMTEEEAALKEQADKEKKEKETPKSDSKDKKGKKGKKDSKKDADVKEKKSKDLNFDLDNRRYRMARLTPRSSFVGDYYLSKKGDKFYYCAGSTEAGANLYCRDLKKGDTKVLARGISGGFVPDDKGDNLFVFTGYGMNKVSLSDGKVTPIEFDAPYNRHPSQERAYIYDHMLKQVKNKFYDANLHGLDWDSIGNHYRRFLPHIDNNRDFAILMSEVLGELNASHTGASTSSYAPVYFMSTASLGAFYDPAHKGDGLKVAEVLRRGPLDRKDVNVVPGDVIVAIDGQTIEAGKDYFPLLEGKAGRKVRLTVKNNAGATRDVTVKPISGGYESSLLYQRWVERNEHLVDSLSGGRLAYVHVEGMNNPSFQTVYDRLLGHYRNAEAAIVDTRYNGGGWLHNDIALLLSGKEYVRFMPRGRYIGSEPFSQWTKPSVMLVNESNYSDAHGTPFVYQTLGIGDIVGAPVPGTMTAVWWENQIDPSIVFGIPQVTSVDMKGQVLENHQLNPDVLIYNLPDQIQAGQDAQLEGAVKHLLKKLDAKK